MLVRNPKRLFLPRLSVTVVTCLALAGGTIIVPQAWPEDEVPSLTPTNRNLPLNALAENPGARIEKQAQSHRLFIKRPERSARLMCPERALTSRPCNPGPQALRSLPRGNLSPARSQPNSPDDPSQPLLS